MKDDEIHTSEIRPKVPGFDRRDRTVRGNVTGGDVHSPGTVVTIHLVHFHVTAVAGEPFKQGDLVELENGLWWKVN